MPSTEHSQQAQYTLSAPSLAELLAQASALVHQHGVRHETQRGTTWSLNGVLLTWLDPAHDTTPLPQWTQADINWYLDTFVAKRSENDPAQPSSPGALVFPYTYAARSRFWDGGWGYLSAWMQAYTQAAHSDIPWHDQMNAARESFAAFQNFLAEAGERLHLQTALSLCSLYPPPTDAPESWLLKRWHEAPERVDVLVQAWRRDLLAAAIDDIATMPQSRRAIVSSFCYPQLEEQLLPRMGLPPYQFFQFLPGEADEPLQSIHLHRSLDVAGGAPLDFYHDLAWLREAGVGLGRPIGNISVVANNLHAYDLSVSTETIEEWLCRVTDGYRTGNEAPRKLVEMPAYRANIERIWARWQRKG